MIAIIDTGGANLASVSNALARLSIHWQFTTDVKTIQAASHVILPGVGAAKDSMQRLDDLELVPVIRSLRQPVLGICLGMQLLFKGSDEGVVNCLGVVDGFVRRLKGGKGLRVPHMGWNALEISAAGCTLLDGVRTDDHFYFVHSYCCAKGAWVRACADHGETFVAVIQQDNFFGCQFHPERSANAGARILRNFAKL